MDIPAGSSASAIADHLKRAGLIRSGMVFVTAAKLLGHSNDMKAGEYLIPPNKGVFEIIDQLTAGRAEAQWVVIPEGKSVPQIAAILEARALARRGEFEAAAARKPRRYGLELPVPRASVEGYLMPDTYKFPKRISERAIIRQMLQNWNAKVYRPNHARFRAGSLPVDKVVILASLIEREAKVPQDRPLISAVIHNRLQRKMMLQIDATVIHALGHHKDRLTYADLKTKSPYNTYLHYGLPPGPICNPGLASILAALQPASVSYLYYVAQPDGSHIFSRTGAEHEAAKQRVKAMAG